jgi:hypothetical protein
VIVPHAHAADERAPSCCELKFEKQQCTGSVQLCDALVSV